MKMSASKIILLIVPIGKTETDIDTVSVSGVRVMDSYVQVAVGRGLWDVNFEEKNFDTRYKYVQLHSKIKHTFSFIFLVFNDFPWYLVIDLHYTIFILQPVILSQLKYQKHSS